MDEGQKDDDEGNSFEDNDYGELSFDYRHDEQELDNPCTSGNSMEASSFSFWFLTLSFHINYTFDMNYHTRISYSNFVGR